MILSLVKQYHVNFEVKERHNYYKNCLNLNKQMAVKTTLIQYNIILLQEMNWWTMEFARLWTWIFCVVKTINNAICQTFCYIVILCLRMQNCNVSFFMNNVIDYNSTCRCQVFNSFFRWILFVRTKNMPRGILDININPVDAQGSPQGFSMSPQTCHYWCQCPKFSFILINI